MRATTHAQEDERKDWGDQDNNNKYLEFVVRSARHLEGSEILALLGESKQRRT